MQKRSVIFRAVLVTVALVFLVQQGETRCNVCDTKGHACINETSFQMCVDGERVQDQIYNCPADAICVNSQLRCAIRTASIQPDCVVDASCGQCDGINMFTCTSRRTYVQCNDTEPILSRVGRCPDGFTCDVTNPEICVSACKTPASPQCTNDEPPTL